MCGARGHGRRYCSNEHGGGAGGSLHGTQASTSVPCACSCDMPCAECAAGRATSTAQHRAEPHLKQQGVQEDGESEACGNPVLSTHWL